MPKKSAWIVFFAALLAVLPARLYQIFVLKEANNGFAGVVVNAGLALGTVLLLALDFPARAPAREYRPFRSLSAAVLSTLGGLALVLQSAAAMAADAAQNPFIYMILALLGILAGGVLIFTGYGFSIGKNLFENHPFASLLPPLWGCFCLFALFISYVGIVNVAQNVYNTLAVIFLLLFLFTQAKLFAGVEGGKAAQRLGLFGMPAALFLFATGIPGSAALLAGAQQNGFFPAGLYFVNVVMGCYVLVFLAAFRAAPGGAQSPLPAEEFAPREEAPPQAENPADWERCAALLESEYRSAPAFAAREPSPFRPN